MKLLKKFIISPRTISRERLQLCVHHLLDGAGAVIAPRSYRGDDDAHTRRIRSLFSFIPRSSSNGHRSVVVYVLPLRKVLDPDNARHIVPDDVHQESFSISGHHGYEHLPELRWRLDPLSRTDSIASKASIQSVEPFSAFEPDSPFQLASSSSAEALLVVYIVAPPWIRRRCRITDNVVDFGQMLGRTLLLDLIVCMGLGPTNFKRLVFGRALHLDLIVCKGLRPSILFDLLHIFLVYLRKM